MELIQFSTLKCPPCRDAREYITRNYDVELINYTYVPFEYINDFDPRYEKLANDLQVRGVPYFVILDEENVLHTFSGFGPKSKQKVDQYVSYLTKAGGNEIKNCLPEEVELRLQEAYNKSLELIQPDLDNLGIDTPPSLNGHKEEDEDDEYWDKI